MCACVHVCTCSASLTKPPALNHRCFPQLTLLNHLLEIPSLTAIVWVQFSPFCCLTMTTKTSTWVVAGTDPIPTITVTLAFLLPKGGIYMAASQSRQVLTMAEGLQQHIQGFSMREDSAVTCSFWGCFYAWNPTKSYKKDYTKCS